MNFFGLKSRNSGLKNLNNLGYFLSSGEISSSTNKRKTLQSENLIDSIDSDVKYLLEWKNCADFDLIKFHLPAGMSVISLPVIPADASPSVVFSAYEQVGGTINVSGRDEAGLPVVYTPGFPFNNLSELIPGFGYEVDSENAWTLVVCGTKIVENFKIDLNSGINFVGYYNENPTPVEDYFSSLIDSSTLVSVETTQEDQTFSYVVGDPPENQTLTTLEKGKGYKVQVVADVLAENW